MTSCRGDAVNSAAPARQSVAPLTQTWWTVYVANVTSLNLEARKHLCHQTDEVKVVLLHEHHLDGSKWDTARFQFWKQGWQLQGRPASATDKGGTKGSPALLVRRHTDYQHEGQYGHNGPGFEYDILRWKGPELGPHLRVSGCQ